MEAWAEGRYELLLSPQIFDEYSRTCDRLGASRPGLEYRGVLTTLIGHGTLVPDVEVLEPITADPDDDKFLACAQATGAVVVSGDKHILDAAGWRGVDVLTPRAFLKLLSAESA